MHTAIEAIIIQGHRPKLPYLATGLGSLGWNVRTCESTDTLGELAESCAPQVVILENGDSDLRTAVGIARYGVPNAALIVLVDDADVDDRIVALDAGADACCLMSTDVREICALGRALSRTRKTTPERSGRDTPLWRLTHSGRVLAGPRGQSLPLTFTESAFFLRLLSSPGHRLPRERLVTTPVVGPRRRQSTRSVDVMVSRLRAKAERLGVGLPLLAVRQWGYILLADVAPDGQGDARPSTAPQSSSQSQANYIN
ncbi:winged helix-turn-helix domain-containing protein [Bordetella sp. 15P40C-2]|uniref:winged helix-turn-helix domain-containing protein n=1 Tax=Bordetella sp. 15P40C-2 TaxID=2572246 RepID=UPI00132B3407|nr:winged helix-turn-helix domain-containing protein [Bordetella sp. 15P40C-2]MVW72587.1 transcriptional regulator [Bordetella sp. 15P40C-2]